MLCHGDGAADEWACGIGATPCLVSDIVRWR